LKKFILPIFIIAMVLVLDQWLKYWVHTHIYESHKVIFPNWFLLYYTENNGMAFGVEFGGIAGKIVLTVFRIIAVIAIAWYIFRQIKYRAARGFIICVSLILAGAIGNIIDSVFYGIVYRSQNMPLFQGRVIDMLYFPIIDSYFPDWLPFWGGERFQFFRPVFNIADASISTGIIAILLFQKYFFKHKHHPSVQPMEGDMYLEINDGNTVANSKENPNMPDEVNRDSENNSSDESKEEKKINGEEIQSDKN